MKLKIIKLFDALEDDVRIEPSSTKREWMDETSNKYAYRCLPLNIANQHGWSVYLKEPLMAGWNGGSSLEDVYVQPENNRSAMSAFGHGILTFHLNFLVQTPKDYGLYITGAPNHFINGAKPMTGIFESDWAPYSFTMNWQLEEGKRVKFKTTDPICFFFPIHRHYLEEFTLECESIENQDEDYQKHYQEFCDSRTSFLNREDRSSAEWQKRYFQGKFPDGTKCPYANHKTKIDVK